MSITVSLLSTATPVSDPSCGSITIMNMCHPMTGVDGFATAGIPDTWLMPFLLRATPRLDLAGWSLRSEVNLDGDRACWRHIRPDPQRYETSQRLPSSLHQGILRARLLTFGSMPVTRLLLISRVSG